jgi:hypothetical protein
MSIAYKLNTHCYKRGEEDAEEQHRQVNATSHGLNISTVVEMHDTFPT